MYVHICMNAYAEGGFDKRAQQPADARGISLSGAGLEVYAVLLALLQLLWHTRLDVSHVLPCSSIALLASSCTSLRTPRRYQISIS